MNGRTKMNAVRSGIVVVGTLAFGWLSLELVYKPILRKAQTVLETQSQQSAALDDEAIAARESSRNQELLEDD